MAAPIENGMVQSPTMPRSAYEEVYLQENSLIPCPSCSSRAVFRLHRSSLEKLATALSGAYPYVCKNCHTKFYKKQKLD